MGECLYSGKVKQVWSTDDPDILEFRYTDQISVFDQIIPSLIPRKGESLNRTTCHWFGLVEEEGICRTHIVERNGANRCLVRRVDIYREPGTLPRDGEWVFVPLEFVCRQYLAGSGWRRYARGELSAEELGFEAGTDLTQGVKLPAPYLEITTKFEAYDRLIDREEALEIANISGEELDSLLEVVLKVDSLIEREAALRGLIHVDGKKEFALGPGRVPVLVDSFGTLDEDRWWDAEQYKLGTIVQLSKEFVREHYIGTGHQEQLRIARDSGNEDPAIPALPQEVIDQTAALYASMFERLTGNKF
ncbi:MAG TPA: phosphoribosylaminoimidazolesuccinocarboxamide synthase [Candidatus Poseidoniales archaeon]|jgi:phosphoribosylaminoimidazole-succinocarboxamide synthase|nr:MAG: phosphoribosylaminoimidazolesuccinocarboxamide synthase [Euryarchaeota archaeon]HIG02982.1 phosphoribosylaminoimidazolesuccinocarboxamide synthase [Candidatus Poseidoniales archaeon]HIL64916.1 phosphoribosylaminoimidazolesuccinocarboxamide synthase [Candidatus Poseidoniales archaeon]